MPEKEEENKKLDRGKDKRKAISDLWDEAEMSDKPVDGEG